MAVINGCEIPEDLHYWVAKHIWLRLDAPDLVTLGITDPAQGLAGKVIAVTPKAVGRSVGRGKSVATMESGKWVGPVQTPVGGEIVAVNQALKTSPQRVNQDPYGEGWIVQLRPADWEGEAGGLERGQAALEAYRQLLTAEGIRCE